ncbi:hypothetical protein OQA88_11656 [Cercophora sp. LCS_1]
MAGARSVITPVFDSTIIDYDRTDGYWVETFQFSKEDKVPGVITSGLRSGYIEFLDNPIAAAGGDPKAEVSGTWKKYRIAKFDSPVAVLVADISGNGLTDVVVCHDYGPFMLNCNQQGGWITWLENPGRSCLNNGYWRQRTIGRWPAMHRMKAGYFTQKHVVLPVTVTAQVEWPRSIVDDENFTLIHELARRKLSGADGLDSLLVASREGTTWVYFEDGGWKRRTIGIGEPQEPWQSPTAVLPSTGDHWGSGCADAGGLGDDPVAYIPTLDPYHGVTACVYTKVNRGIDHDEWKRHILDIYGTPTQLRKNGDGPGHYIVCDDFDGDGDQEWLLSLMGPAERDEDGVMKTPPAGPHPDKGIMYYKAIDLAKGLFAKWRIATESSARIAVGDFAGKGNLDIISLSYNVSKYYEEPCPVVRLHLNKTPKAAPRVKNSAITPTVWDGEGLVYLGLPSEVSSSQSAPLIEIANYALSVEVHPKGAKIPVDTGEGIKVLYGAVAEIHGTRSALGVRPFPTLASTTSEDSSLSADAESGAILLRLTPINDTDEGEWASADEVPVRTTFDASELGLALDPLVFKKVETLWWGGDFKDVDFYNLSGFHFRFQHDKSQICHLQFWTAGTNVNCGVHNHSGDIFQEVHICLSPGTGGGGMSRIKEEFEDTPADEVKDLPNSAFDTVPLPELYEHGGLWDRDSYDKPVRGDLNVVSYPWHKWQAGSGKNVDVWLALEFNPDLPGLT